jgi:hypothetical protein
MHIKRFNENNIFSVDKIESYLFGFYNDNDPVEIKSGEKWVYIGYIVDPNDDIRLLYNYLNGPRFVDYKYICSIIYDLLSIIIIDKQFYNDNLDIAVDNLKWVKHSSLKDLDKKEKLSPYELEMMEMMKDCKEVIGLRNNCTLIKNRDERTNWIEFWPKEKKENTLYVHLKCDAYLQCLLYTYAI